MSINGLRAMIDQLRTIPGNILTPGLGVRPFRVNIVRITHSTASGDPLDRPLPPQIVETPLLVGATSDGYQGAQPKVRSVNDQDIISSGGLYRLGDYKIGPFTPYYGTGGLLPEDLDPPVTSQETEIYFRLLGPGVDPSELFKKVKTETDRIFSYRIVVRPTAAREI